MNSSHHKGFPVIEGGLAADMPINCYLIKIVYQPTDDLRATVGFALIEAREEPRKSAIRFAPRLELAESIAAAVRGKPIKEVLLRAEPSIASIIAGMNSENSIIFPQNHDIPPELKIFTPEHLKTHNFEQELDRQSEDLFVTLELWAKANPSPKSRNYGQSYIQRSLHQAFVDRGLFWRKELQKRISVERFVSDHRLRWIYLAYKDLRNDKAKVYRMLHPVSVFGSSKNAEVMVKNWSQICDGLQNELQMNCEMRAIVENAPQNKSTNRVEALRALQGAGIWVDPVSSLPALAADAQAALRFA